VNWHPCTPEAANRWFATIKRHTGNKFVPVTLTETSGPAHTRGESAVFDMPPPNTPGEHSTMRPRSPLKNSKIGRLRLQSNTTSRKLIRPALPSRPRKMAHRANQSLFFAIFRGKNGPSGLNSVAKQESTDDALSGSSLIPPNRAVYQTRSSRQLLPGSDKSAAMEFQPRPLFR